MLLNPGLAIGDGGRPGVGIRVVRIVGSNGPSFYLKNRPPLSGRTQDELDGWVCSKLHLVLQTVEIHSGDKGTFPGHLRFPLHDRGQSQGLENGEAVSARRGAHRGRELDRELLHHVFGEVATTVSAGNFIRVREEIPLEAVAGGFVGEDARIEKFEIRIARFLEKRSSIDPILL